MEQNSEPSAASSKTVGEPATPHGLPRRWASVAGALVLVSFISRHGFRISPEVVRWLDGLDILLAISLTLDLVLPLIWNKDRRRVFASRGFEYLLLFGLALFLGGLWLWPAADRAAAFEFFRFDSWGTAAMGMVRLFLVFAVAFQLIRGVQRLTSRGVRPEWILAGSFASLILVGSLLLLLPKSTARVDQPISLIDALFTATSAACVTGLTVRDTAADFSPFGQATILFLFQLGGLGVVTFVAFVSVLSARSLPVPQMILFRQMINAPAISDLRRQILGIVVGAAVIELLGAVLLYQFLTGEHDTATRIWWSAFHAISAFCNAGFALQTDSLVPFAGNMGLLVTIMTLVVLGGFGFLSLLELLNYRVTRLNVFRRIGFIRRLHAGQLPSRLSLQTRLALTVTLLLLIVGFIGFFILESNHLLRDRPVPEKILAAAFQSVTPRTAGFNTVAIEKLRNATLVFLMVLMVIGANPVSTGGGIKTLSFAILVLALRAMIARRERVEAFGRTIPSKTLFAALSVFVIYVATATAGIFLLALFNPELAMRDQMFEVVSALSTVGLSTGITAQLAPASKLVLCLAMFIGRVGPISLVLSVFQSRASLAYEFPEEEVVVG